ncbi:MAG: hypothetical protein K9M45_10435 [Kiritimatiellales bacterium]|nr:hypothetical protein [Kiritimatiellales bacterium]
MLGIEDPWVVAPYLLCIASTLLCLAWGILKWNKEDPETEMDKQIQHWAEEENQVESEL